jgi:hypothetical protein
MARMISPGLNFRFGRPVPIINRAVGNGTSPIILVLASSGMTSLAELGEDSTPHLTAELFQRPPPRSAGSICPTFRRPGSRLSGRPGCLGLFS